MDCAGSSPGSNFEVEEIMKEIVKIQRKNDVSIGLKKTHKRAKDKRAKRRIKETRKKAAEREAQCGIPIVSKTAIQQRANKAAKKKLYKSKLKSRTKVSSKKAMRRK